MSVRLGSSCAGREPTLPVAEPQAAEAQACRSLFPAVSRLCQLLRGVTISNGGVLPRIHPELLSKKRGSRAKADSQATVADKPAEHSKSKKPVKTVKKVKGKRGRKPKVSRRRPPVAAGPHLTTLVQNSSLDYFPPFSSSCTERRQ